MSSDASRTIPLYESIADRLEEMINRGVFEPGERLPSIRQLHADYRVSINTAREAYTLLEARGVAEPHAQIGHFVRLGPPICEGDEMEFPAVSSAIPLDVSSPALTRQVLAESAAEGWINLATAEPPAALLPTRRLAELTARRLRNDHDVVARYQFPPGPVEVRQEIAKRIFGGGLSVSADQVVMTAGCLEAVFLALMTICRHGDAVLIESPGFYLFYQLLQRLGLRAIELPCRPGLGVDPDDLEQAVRNGKEAGARVSAALLVPNFSNPVGAVASEENKRAIARILGRERVCLIEDDMYGEMSWDGSRPPKLASFADPERYLICSSFSKTVAPGYRIGWLAGGRELVREAEHNKLLTSVAVSGPAMWGITDYLAHGGYERWLRAARRHYRDTFAQIRSTVYDCFPEGTRSTRPDGGMVIWVALPSGCDVIDLYNRCRAEKISFAPGPIFSLSGGYRNCLRLNATQWNETIERAIRRIGALASTVDV